MAAREVVMNVVEWLRSQVGASAQLTQDSRRVMAGDVFFACVGQRSDGRQFIAKAVAAGAAAIVYEQINDAVVDDTIYDHHLPCLGVRDLPIHLGEIAAAWYGNPAESMTVIAVTGTNGKTSCTQWLAKVLSDAGQACGVMGTLGVRLPDGSQIETGLTTPDAILLHRALAEMKKQGAVAVAIEASSIGLAEGRLAGLKIDIAAMTNLTRDHLDYHGDMQQYEQEKQRLFEWPGLKAVVNNFDDEASLRLLQLAESRGVKASYGFSLRPSALSSPSFKLIQATSLHSSTQGMTFTLKADDVEFQMLTHLLGAHNVANLLLVAGVLRSMGWSWKKIVNDLSQAQAARGRLEPVVNKAGTPLVVIDYAHTADALLRALEALLPLAQARQGAIFCVVGCGGDRDVGKRPLMMRAAFDHANTVIVTSDNPRSESAQAIANDMLAGLVAQEQSQVLVELDRAQAIRLAVNSAQPTDIVLIAGKGHEQYQEISGQSYPFCDREQALAALKQYDAAIPLGLMTLSEAANCMKGVVHADSDQAQGLRFSRVSTDSRQLSVGELYIAIKGDVFDGHDYIQQAQAGGAVAAVVSKPIASDLPQIIVDDPRIALGRLAKKWRTHFNTPVIAVVGSNGKTSTKEMISSVLAKAYSESYRLATQGNLNNDIGVPLTLLRMRKAHRAAVIEMGMNHVGEIAYLADITAATVVVMTNAQREHQEFMHSVEAVAVENGEAFLSLASDGVAVYPLDDDYAMIWKEQIGSKRAITFAWNDPQADVFVKSSVMHHVKTCVLLHTPQGECALELSLLGDHHVRNAMAAVCAGLALNLSLDQIRDGLQSFNPVQGRMQWHQRDGISLIDDTYNANPDSVLAAIKVLATLPAPHCLVLGDMGEVGESGPQVHEELGVFARQQGISELYTFGTASKLSAQAFGNQAVHFSDIHELCHAVLTSHAKSILVKGSRFMKMERVVDAWLKN